MKSFLKISAISSNFLATDKLICKHFTRLVRGNLLTGKVCLSSYLALKRPCLDKKYQINYILSMYAICLAPQPFFFLDWQGHMTRFCKGLCGIELCGRLGHLLSFFLLKRVYICYGAPVVVRKGITGLCVPPQDFVSMKTAYWRWYILT